MKTSSANLPAWRSIAAFLTLTALVGALWHFAFDAYRESELAQHRRELAAISEVQIQRIQGWLGERRSDAAVLAGLTFARDALAAAPDAPQRADHQRQLDLYLKNYDYRAVLLFDRSARLHLAAGAADSDDMAAIVADNSGFANRDGIRIASLRLRKANENTRLLLQIVAPVNVQGARAGTLVLLVDALAALDPLAAVNRERVRSREVAIFEARGEELRALNTPLFGRPAELSVEAGNPLRPAAMAAQGKTGPMEGEDYRGVAVMAHVGRTPGIGWLVVTKQDRADVFAPIRRVALWSGVLTVLLLLATAIALSGWRRIRLGALNDAAQQALRASEARFRKLHEHGADIAVLFDRDMVMRYASRSAERLFGRDIVGDPISSGSARVHPDDFARVEAARKAALAAPGVPQHVQHRLRNEQGGWWTVEATFTSHLDDPEIGGLSYEAHDISERTLAEEALQRERDLLQTVIDGARHSHLVYLDRDFFFVRVNAAYAATCGYRPEEMIGRNHFELYPHAENEAIFARVRDTGEPFEIRDKPFAFPDQPERGTTWWDWTLTPVKDAAGRVEGLVFSLFETTARKRAEQALRESEERYRFLFELSPDAVFVHADGIIRFANAAAARLFRADSAQAMIGRHWQELVDEQFWPKIQARIAVLTSGVVPYLLPTELTYRGLDGTPILVESTGARIVVDGKPAIMSVQRDITERRHGEERRIEQTRRQRDTLVREVHHRIKNHLQGLVGLLCQHFAEHPDLQQVLEKFVAQINAISAVHGLQGKSGSGRTSLRGLITDIISALRGLLGATIHFGKEDVQCFVGNTCAQAGLCQWTLSGEESVPVALIVNELLTNAVRHGDGGAVAVAIRCDPLGARLTLRNGGRLAEGVDVGARKGLGTGLSLIRALMPPQGLALALRNHPDGGVEAELLMTAPIVERTPQDQLASLR
jgi:PAS domain S-box-containing protein